MYREFVALLHSIESVGNGVYIEGLSFYIEREGESMMLHS